MANNRKKRKKRKRSRGSSGFSSKTAPSSVFAALKDEVGEVDPAASTEIAEPKQAASNVEQASVSANASANVASTKDGDKAAAVGNTSPSEAASLTSDAQHLEEALHNADSSAPNETAETVMQDSAKGSAVGEPLETSQGEPQDAAREGLQAKTGNVAKDRDEGLDAVRSEGVVKDNAQDVVGAAVQGDSKGLANAEPQGVAEDITAGQALDNAQGVAPDQAIHSSSVVDTPVSNATATDEPEPTPEVALDSSVQEIPAAANQDDLDNNSDYSDNQAVGSARSQASEASEAEKPKPKRPFPRVMAVVNQKGGVGKTTTAVSLGACFADAGHRTLIIDLDPQGNASTALGIDTRSLSESMYHVMMRQVELDECTEACEVRNLFIAPATNQLSRAAIELVPEMNHQYRLKEVLEPIKEDYDYILIDCPPSLGVLTVAALAAATELIVTVQTEYLALEGLSQLMETVDEATKYMNRDLVISHLVLTMFDSRTRLAGEVVDDVRRHFGDKVCKNVIPRSVRISEAPSHGLPVTLHAPDSTGAKAYRAVAKEIM